MAIQIVMDRTGDSRHSFDPNDAHPISTGFRLVHLRERT
jgi:hypothetical protein